MEEMENFNTVLQEIHKPTITAGSAEIKPLSSSPGVALALFMVGFVLINRLKRFGSDSNKPREYGDRESDLEKEYAYAYLKREYKKHAERKRINR